MAGGAAAAEELRVTGNRLFIPVRINGHAMEALLDSGAEMTLIDAAAAARLGLTASGTAEARGTGKGTQKVQFAQNLEIAAAGVVMKGRTAAVMDLSDISARIVGEPVAVVLGRDLFDAGRFYLNIEEARFEKVSAARRPKGMRLPLNDHRGIKQIPVRIEGHAPVWADFDLGNGSGMLIGRKYADANGLLSENRLIGTREGGGIGGAVTRQIVRVKSIEIAGKTVRKIEAAIDPAPDASDANVGVALLRRFEMVIDFSANAVWLTATRHKRGRD